MPAAQAEDVPVRVIAAARIFSLETESKAGRGEDPRAAGVAQQRGHHGRFEGIDLLEEQGETLQFSVVSAADKLFQNGMEHKIP